MENKLTMHKNILDIQQGIESLYSYIYDEFSQDWKSFSLTIGDSSYEINGSLEGHEEIKDLVIREILKNAILSFIDDDADINAFGAIERILNGARKEDHEFDRIKNEVVSNLDENGQPITAKPLDHDSVYVKWQDKNKFKFEDDEEEYEKLIKNKSLRDHHDNK